MTHNVEDIIVFLGLKHVFNSDHYYMFSCGRNAQVTSVEKPQLKIIGFQNYNYIIEKTTGMFLAWIEKLHRSPGKAGFPN